MFDVYAQGLNVAPFRSGLDREEAIQLAARLTLQEGKCWIKETGSLHDKAEMIYADGTIEKIVLDEDGLPLVAVS